MLQKSQFLQNELPDTRQLHLFIHGCGNKVINSLFLTTTGHRRIVIWRYFKILKINKQFNKCSAHNLFSSSLLKYEIPSIVQ